MNSQSVNLPPSRAAALTVLDRVLPISGKPGQDLQAALDNTLGSLGDPRDRALTTELCYGFLRHKLRMEHLVKAHLSKPESSPAWLIRICGLAAYELAFLDSVPAHASLSWAVDAVKMHLGDAMGKVANAVLRRVQELGEDAGNYDFYYRTSRNEDDARCIWYSVPFWLYRMWLSDYGDAFTRAMLESQFRPPLTGVRVNNSKQGAHELFSSLEIRHAAVQSLYPWLAFLPGGNSGLLTELKDLEAKGAASRQSMAAGIALTTLGMGDWPGPVWDACSGRGGKTLALAESGKMVWASDPSIKRLKGLIRESTRLGLNHPPVFRCDASRPPLRQSPGTILIDAPCSGLGVLSRRPDSKWKRSPKDIEALTGIQTDIIHAAAAALRPGGLLAYMTCTLAKGENERQGELISSLGFKPKAVTEVDLKNDVREFFWGGVWEKN